ncbi:MULTISPECIES: type II toxin-antitoxin system prevent-host-death family antitoxin [Hyphomicrobiales]|uniref:Antitoxin n=2 Tax=Hyphomicrobiales TaxID=356 RepID=A0A6L3Y7E2_9HYPH|nr:MULTISPECIES: type II toxin-antitoxin system prevent-host-death family antitoxin [Hyphomicrobiales]KAB2678413.1 type II toxin-antitoxin system prevent-host-death family antitoxin [Brucella tritici]MBO0130436.1 type II toxin-antitoxin system prevent-host-death family antitoxin [Agrobacterium burrii]
MPTTTSLEFQRKFGQYLNESHREPVEITRHGRREFVLMSAAQYDALLSAAQHMGNTIKAASEPEQN